MLPFEVFHVGLQQHGQEAAGKLFHYEVDTVNQVQKRSRWRMDRLIIFCCDFFGSWLKIIFDIDSWMNSCKNILYDYRCIYTQFYIYAHLTNVWYTYIWSYIPMPKYRYLDIYIYTQNESVCFCIGTSTSQFGFVWGKNPSAYNVFDLPWGHSGGRLFEGFYLIVGSKNGCQWW